MKNVINLIFLSIILISCTKEDKTSDTRECTEVEYNKDFEIKLSEQVCFPDGNSLTLTNVEHQFCPCGSVCIWAGDLLVTLTISIDQEIDKVKTLYPSKIEIDRSIFINHEITSLSYTYGTEDEIVPTCAEDFEPEKMALIFSISPI